MTSTGSPQPEGTVLTTESAPVVTARALAAPSPRALTAAEPPAVLSMTPTLPGLLAAARRRWRLAMFLGLFFGAAGAAGAWFMQPEIFTARTLIHIAFAKQVLLSPIQAHSDFGSFQRTQVVFVKSRPVLNAALRDPKVAEFKTVKDHTNPVTWLEQEIQVDFATAPEIMRISMRGEKADELIAIVNAVREAYLGEVRRMEVEGHEKQIKKLDELYVDKDERRQRQGKLLKELLEDLGTGKDPKAADRAHQFVLKSLEMLESDLTQNSLKLLGLKMELEMMLARNSKQPERQVSPAEIDDAVAKDQEALDYQKQIDAIGAEAEVLKKRFLEPEKELKYQQLQESRSIAEKNLKTRQDHLRATYGKQVSEKRGAESSAALAELKHKIAVHEEQGLWLKGELDKRVKSFQGLGKKQIELDWLRDEIAIYDNIAKQFAAKREHLQIEMQAPDRFNLLEEAYSVPDKDGRIKKAGMVGGGLFAFVVLAVAFLEFRSRRVSSIDELTHGLRMRLMGALPAQRRRRFANNDARWQNQMTESVESARTMLLHTAQSESLRLIVVTSAVNGEGKTLTCSHLAASLARAGRKTLLIDADLRRPSLQKIFNLPHQAGFGELLRGEVGLTEAVQITGVYGLSVMTAGNCDDRAIQALSQPVLDNVFRAVKEQYDFVIVDSAPVLLVADSQLISLRSDGVLLSVLRDVSRLQQIYTAQERLAALKVRVLGVVLNGAEGSVNGSYYPYGRGAKAAITQV